MGRLKIVDVKKGKVICEFPSSDEAVTHVLGLNDGLDARRLTAVNTHADDASIPRSQVHLKFDDECQNTCEFNSEALAEIAKQELRKYVGRLVNDVDVPTLEIRICDDLDSEKRA